MMSPSLRSLLRGRFFAPSDQSSDGWSSIDPRGRSWEHAYRDRWQHDRVVRSTHGVN
jgi:nitrate reductase alpha subunit